MVRQAVIALIGHADARGDHFQKPKRQGVFWVVQNIFVQHQMAFHGVWTQAVGFHDVVHRAMRGGHPLIHFF